MRHQTHGMQRTVGLVVLGIALAAMASQPLVAADQTVEVTGGTTPAFVGFWTGPTSQVLIFVVAVPDEAPEPPAEEDNKDEDRVILEDGAPF